MILFKRMIEPPCIIEKCLKWAVCRNRHYIPCTKLHEYHNKLIDNYSRQRRWKIMNKHFPRLISICSDIGKPYPPRTRKIS
jgi:hypothetical protein